VQPLCINTMELIENTNWVHYLFSVTCESGLAASAAGCSSLLGLRNKLALS
jgi:hypothetical protein